MPAQALIRGKKTLIVPWFYFRDAALPRTRRSQQVWSDSSHPEFIYLFRGEADLSSLWYMWTKYRVLPAAGLVCLLHIAQNIISDRGVTVHFKPRYYWATLAEVRSARVDSFRVSVFLTVYVHGYQCVPATVYVCVCGGTWGAVCVCLLDRRRASAHHLSWANWCLGKWEKCP